MSKTALHFSYYQPPPPPPAPAPSPHFPPLQPPSSPVAPPPLPPHVQPPQPQPQPQPQPHPIPPPPPHVHPPPHPLPPPLPPSPDHPPTVIIIVIVSCGGLFLLAFMAVALLCCLKKRKKKTQEEIDILRFDEHRKVTEEIVKGPHGTEAMVITVEDDVHIDGEIIKNSGREKLGDSKDGISEGGNEAGESSSHVATAVVPTKPDQLISVQHEHHQHQPVGHTTTN